MSEPLRSEAAFAPRASPSAGLRIDVTSVRRRGKLAATWLVAFVPVLWLGLDDGGYWPTAWGWTSLLFLFVCAAIVIVRGELVRGGRELLYAGGLLVFTLWGVASAAWSASATEPLQESQRTLAYAAAVLGALLLARARTYRTLVAGVWAAVSVVSLYALLSRLFPERLGYYDALAGYRLEAPLGYWNALGLFAAIGTLLAVGFAARGKSIAVRTLAGASTVVLVPTLYFTFSRGAWIALGLGLVTMVALDPRRLQLVTSLLVAAVWPALAIWHVSSSVALTHIGGTIAAEETAGRHFLYFLGAMVLGAALSIAVVALLGRRVLIPRTARRGYGGVLLVGLVVAIAGVLVQYGSPITLARKGYHELVGPSHVVANGNLNSRLFSLGLGERIPQWRVAWREYSAHPLLGGGLGTYERYWNEYRPDASQVINVHNLYLETLAELGPIGLVLLVTALLAPLLALRRARRRALISAAAGAYVAFLGHAAVDWDWQMPAVTLAALFSGAAILAAGRRGAAPSGARVARWRVGLVGGLVLLGVAAFVGLRGNQALTASQAAAAKGDWSVSAADARSARFWAPWSSQPWELLGEAQSAVGQNAAARKSFDTAIQKDNTDWTIWLDLAVISNGRARSAAFAAATRLNPLSPEIASWRHAAAPGAKA